MAVPEIPEGAVQIHMYDFKNVLRPRGHMKKESIGPYLLDRLLACYESWTDKKYGDNPEVPVLLAQLQNNLQEEVDGAWRDFIIGIKSQ